MHEPGHDLVFYANRSTPQVVRRGEDPRPKRNYGDVTSRRPAGPKEETVISSGKWLRVDEAGNTPRNPEYKKTQYRPWLVEAPVQKNDSISAFGVDHGYVSKSASMKNAGKILTAMQRNGFTDRRAAEWALGRDALGKAGLSSQITGKMDDRAARALLKQRGTSATPYGPRFTPDQGKSYPH